MSTQKQPEVGWLIEIEGQKVGTPPRTGEIVEVLGEPGRRHYRVRWQDGHESIHYPSNDARIRPPEHSTA